MIETKNDFEELDPVQVEDLDLLQKQARFNTRQIFDSAKRRDALNLEIEALKHRLDTEELSTKDRSVLERDLEKLTKEKDLHVNNVEVRRVRSSKIVRRRMDLEQVKQQKEKKVKEDQNSELSEKFGVNTFISRKQQIEYQLAALLADVTHAQFKAGSRGLRDLSRRLVALQRACAASLESFKRIPPLISNDD